MSNFSFFRFRLVRTKIHDTTALGVALVAAHSLDMDVFNVQGKTYDR